MLLAEGHEKTTGRKGGKVSKPVKTAKGTMYHGDPLAIQNQRLRKELNDAKKENERLRKLLEQHDANEDDKLLRDLRQGLQALWHVAERGWPYPGMALVDKRFRKVGDGAAYEKLLEARGQVRAIVIDVSGLEGTNHQGWLDKRENEVINLGKGLVNA